VRNFIIFIKEKLNSMNTDHQLLALDLVDYFVDTCSISLHSQVGSKEFIGKLISLLKSRDAPKVQIKILRLIKKWGEKFQSSADILPNFSITYKNLLNSGIEFPVVDSSSDYQDYIGGGVNTNYESEQKTSSKPQQKVEENKNKSSHYYEGKKEKKVKKSSNFNSSVNNYNNINNGDLVGDSCVKFEPKDFRSKYRTFVGELNILVENIQLANQMIDSSPLGGKVDDGLRMIMLNLKGCEQNLLNAIQGQIKDELLLEICLKVNDDMNNTSERYNLLKAGAQPTDFTSSFGWTTKRKNKSSKKNNYKEEYEKEDNFNQKSSVNKTSSKSTIVKPNNPVNNNQQNEDPFNMFSSSTADNNNNNKPFDPFSNENNNNQTSNNTNKAGTNLLDLNDIINSFSNTNNNTNNQNSSVPVFNFTENKQSKNNVNAPYSVNVNQNQNINNNFDMFNKSSAPQQSNQNKPDISSLLNQMNLNSNQQNNFQQQQQQGQINYYYGGYGNQQIGGQNPPQNFNMMQNNNTVMMSQNLQGGGYQNQMPQKLMGNMQSQMHNNISTNNMGQGFNYGNIGQNYMPSNQIPNQGQGQMQGGFNLDLSTNNQKQKDDNKKLEGINPFA